MKRFIQVSLFSLLALFAVVSVNAGSGFGTEVQIPFAFNVGDKAYEAGTYIVKVQSMTSGGARLSIQDPKTDEIQTVFMNPSGDEPSRNDMRLVFDTIEGRKYLTRVRTSDKSFAIAGSKTPKDAAKSTKSSEKVSVGGAANHF
jgi:hypothetical protein